MSETHVHGIDEANMERRTFLKVIDDGSGPFGCCGYVRLCAECC